MNKAEIKGSFVRVLSHSQHLLGCYSSEVLGNPAQIHQLEGKSSNMSPCLVLHKMHVFLQLKTTHFSLDTACQDEQTVQKNDPRPENLLSPAFRLKTDIFLRLENPFTFELVNFYPSLGIQEIRKYSKKEVFGGALSSLETQRGSPHRTDLGHRHSPGSGCS